MILLLLTLLSVLATSLMTLFSYVMSLVFERQFREPQLLQQVLYGWGISKSKPLLVWLSWVLHYAIGLLFIGCYYLLWNAGALELHLRCATALGFLSGLVAVVGWKVLLTTSGNREKEDDFWYYLQLVVAHLIFAVSAIDAAVYLLRSAVT